MRKTVLLTLATIALASPGVAQAAQCGLPDTQPLWIDFAHGSVQFRNEIFRRPGVIAATSGVAVATALRAGGAHTTYWEMNLPNYVGRPETPADPTTIAAGAARLFDAAAASSGCATPLIALNELWGPTTPAPWLPSVVQYRANVLVFLQELAGRGARPFLLVPSNPNLSGEAEEWWRQVAQVADIVREVYVKAPVIYGQGAILGNRDIRLRLRKAVTTLTGVGIPPGRIGLMLGFQSGGQYGRVGLQPLEAWLEVVKWKTLAARQVASELGAATVWSWGWGTFNAAGTDPEKPIAACSHLWSRDPNLCDAVTMSGGRLSTNVTDGQIQLPAGADCSFGSTTVRVSAIDALVRLTGGRERARTALLARLVQRAQASVATAELLAAERGVVARRFKGVRRAYRAALARRRVTLVLARQILADEVRRQRLARQLAGQTPPLDLVAWTVAEQTKALDRAICLRDELPVAGDVRLAEHVPILRLP